MSYGLTAKLLEGVLPLNGPLNTTTIRIDAADGEELYALRDPILKTLECTKRNYRPPEIPHFFLVSVATLGAKNCVLVQVMVGKVKSSTQHSKRYSMPS
jgi:hypothetical protein